MFDQNTITKEIIYKIISSTESFSLQDLRKEIINSGGTLRLDNGYTVKDFLDDQVHTGNLSIDYTEDGRVYYKINNTEFFSRSTKTRVELEGEIDVLSKQVSDLIQMVNDLKDSHNNLKSDVRKLKKFWPFSKISVNG